MGRYVNGGLVRLYRYYANIDFALEPQKHDDHNDKHYVFYYYRLGFELSFYWLPNAHGFVRVVVVSLPHYIPLPIHIIQEKSKNRTIHLAHNFQEKNKVTLTQYCTQHFIFD